MGRGKPLTDIEKRQIIALNEEKLSANAIAGRIDRSWTVVNKFLSNPDAYGTKKSPGRPKLLSPAATRRLLREASKMGVSASTLKERLDLPVSVRRIQEVLHNATSTVHQKRLACPVLKAEHIAARLQWAIEYVDYGKKWSTVVFSDEKIFNLDGPDGYHSYWRDLRTEREIFSNSQSAGSVFVWGAFSAKGKAELAFLDGTQNAEKYIDTLGDYLFPFAHLQHGRRFVFQHDDASTHTVGAVKQFLKDQNVNVMWWPANSPDLHPMESLWGLLARAVYKNGKQYDTKEELVEAIKNEWEAIPVSKLQSLAKSMKTRCLEVYKADGRRIDC